MVIKEDLQSVKKLLVAIALTSFVVYHFILGVLIGHTITVDLLPSKSHKIAIYIEW